MLIWVYFIIFTDSTVLDDIKNSFLRLNNGKVFKFNENYLTENKISGYSGPFLLFNSYFPSFEYLKKNLKR
jgi:hypothetical protein